MPKDYLVGRVHHVVYPEAKWCVLPDVEHDDDFARRLGQLEVEGGRRVGDAPSGTPPAGRPAAVILAPAGTVGRTIREQPVIYWLLPRATDAPIEITISRRDDHWPLLEARVKPPVSAGIHKINLAELSYKGRPVKLRRGAEYELRIVVDEHRASRDLVATARIERVAGEVQGLAETGDPVEMARRFARASLWFDYLHALNTAIAADPDDAELRRMRARALSARRLPVPTEDEPPGRGGEGASQPGADPPPPGR